MKSRPSIGWTKIMAIGVCFVSHSASFAGVSLSDKAQELIGPPIDAQDRKVLDEVVNRALTEDVKKGLTGSREEIASQLKLSIDYTTMTQDDLLDMLNRVEQLKKQSEAKEVPSFRALQQVRFSDLFSKKVKKKYSERSDLRSKGKKDPGREVAAEGDDVSSASESDTSELNESLAHENTKKKPRKSIKAMVKTLWSDFTNRIVSVTSNDETVAKKLSEQYSIPFSGAAAAAPTFFPEKYVAPASMDGGSAPEPQAMGVDDAASADVDSVQSPTNNGVGLTQKIQKPSEKTPSNDSENSFLDQMLSKLQKVEPKKEASALPNVEKKAPALAEQKKKPEQTENTPKSEEESGAQNTNELNEEELARLNDALSQENDSKGEPVAEPQLANAMNMPPIPEDVSVAEHAPVTPALDTKQSLASKPTPSPASSYASYINTSTPQTASDSGPSDWRDYFSDVSLRTGAAIGSPTLIAAGLATKFLPRSGKNMSSGGSSAASSASAQQVSSAVRGESDPMTFSDAVSGWWNQDENLWDNLAKWWDETPRPAAQPITVASAKPEPIQQKTETQKQKTQMSTASESDYRTEAVGQDVEWVQAPQSESPQQNFAQLQLPPSPVSLALLSHFRAQQEEAARHPASEHPKQESTQEPRDELAVLCNSLPKDYAKVVGQEQLELLQSACERLQSSGTDEIRKLTDQAWNLMSIALQAGARTLKDSELKEQLRTVRQALREAEQSLDASITDKSWLSRLWSGAVEVATGSSDWAKSVKEFKRKSDRVKLAGGNGEAKAIEERIDEIVASERPCPNLSKIVQYYAAKSMKALVSARVLVRVREMIQKGEYDTSKDSPQDVIIRATNDVLGQKLAKDLNIYRTLSIPGMK